MQERINMKNKKYGQLETGNTRYTGNKKPEIQEIQEARNKIYKKQKTRIARNTHDISGNLSMCEGSVDQENLSIIVKAERINC